MTTARSPLSALKAQADRIAATIKAAERGEKVDVLFAERIEAARGKPSLTIGVVMDDKVLKLDVPWSVIRETSEITLAAWILDHMREVRNTVQ